MSKELFKIFKLEDLYLDYNKAYERLKGEYLHYNSLVIAFEFDDTICDKKGKLYNDTIDLLRRLKENNCYLICFSRSNEKYIRDYLEKNNIPFDDINTNPIFFQCRAKKIYYNALLDSRAGILEVYNQLATLMNEIELQKEIKAEIKEGKEVEEFV